MKIKSKLIAGSLMATVACGLVGSITGTFAWYQYSNRSTLSMHGASIGSSQNLELCLGDDHSATSDAWTTDNLSWADIKAAAAFKGSGTNNDELLPASNGGNGGEAALNATWYTNPTGSANLPEVPKTNEVYNNGYFVQFTFYARYVEYKTATASYPAAKLYVDDIASKAIANANPNVSFALRMHVKMGDSTYFLVNPYDSAAKNVTLSSTYTEIPNQYDFTDPAGSPVTVGLPTAANPGTLSTLAHSSVLSTFNDDGSVNTAGKYVQIPAEASTGIAITVTFWLEGFAQQNEADATTDWWEAGTTIGTQLDFGFQLRGVKDAQQ